MLDHGVLAHRFEKIVGKANVMENADGAQVYPVAGLAPALTVTPRSPEELAGVAKAAGQASAAIIPWGGGTMMGRGHVPAAYDVALSLSLLKEIVDFDVDNLTVTVQSGLTLARLQAVLGESTLFLPLNPFSPETATIGGSVAANAGGPGRFHYGSVRDLVLGMRVVLANGEHIHVGGKTVKNVAGYDLGKIFVGSYGSLGIITEVTFRLLPLPQQQKALLVAFDSMESALSLTAHILDSELLPTSLSVLNRTASRWTVGKVHDACLLIVAVDGSLETVERQVRQMTSMMNSFQAQSVSVLDGEERTTLMETIRDFVPAELNSPRETAITANVPLSSASQFVAETENAAAELGLTVGCLVAADTGTVSCVVDGTASSLLIALYNRAVATAGQLDGHCVLDRATPEIQQQLPVWGQPRADWQIARVLKEKFDPQGLFNRGRFVDRI